MPTDVLSPSPAARTADRVEEPCVVVYFGRYYLAADDNEDPLTTTDIAEALVWSRAKAEQYARRFGGADAQSLSAHTDAIETRAADLLAKMDTIAAMRSWLRYYQAQGD